MSLQARNSSLFVVTTPSNLNRFATEGELGWFQIP